MTQKEKNFEDMPLDDEPGGSGVTGGGNGRGQASDTGPTGPFTALSSAELAAVTIEDDEDLEDLSGEVEEGSVRVRMPEDPSAAAEAPSGVPSLDEAAADLDWGLEEAATRAATGADRLEPAPHSPTSLGFAAPPLADAYTVQPGPATPSDAYDKDMAFAPTMGMPSAAPPVVSPFALVADVEVPHPLAGSPVAPPPPPPSPFAPSVTPAPPAPPTYAAPPAMPVQPWGTPVSASSGSVHPIHAPEPLPILDEPLPSTRAIPEMAAPVPRVVAHVDDDFPLPAPRKSSAGTVIGILAGVLIAAVIAAGVWWFQLREKSGTLVLRAAEDAVVTVDGAPATGVSGLFIVRDLAVGPHTVLVVRPGAAPWANAVQIAAGDSLQIEAPGARGGDTGATPPAIATAQPPGVPGLVAPGAPGLGVPGAPGLTTSPAATTPSVDPTTTPPTAPPGATTTAPATTPREPATPRTTPGVTPATTPRTTPAEPATRGGTGFISVQTTPWSAVEIDGRSVGNTPVIRHELRAGDHRVTLIVQAWNIRQTRRVVVRPGETSTVTVRFQEPGTQAAPPQGPRPMGPGAGPMGPRPMGPGPMGPRPMGPGPMGGPPRN